MGGGGRGERSESPESRCWWYARLAEPHKQSHAAITLSL
jgi:hypothetical protein